MYGVFSLRLKITMSSVSSRKVNDHRKTPPDETKTGKKLKTTITHELIGKDSEGRFVYRQHLDTFTATKAHIEELLRV